VCCKATIQIRDEANHVSLSLSPAIWISCPVFATNTSAANMTIKFATAVPQSMFLEKPFVTAGDEFGCKDASGEPAPVRIHKPF